MHRALHCGATGGAASNAGPNSTVQQEVLLGALLDQYQKQLRYLAQMGQRLAGGDVEHCVGAEAFDNHQLTMVLWTAKQGFVVLGL